MAAPYLAKVKYVAQHKYPSWDESLQDFTLIGDVPTIKFFWHEIQNFTMIEYF